MSDSVFRIACVRIKQNEVSISLAVCNQIVSDGRVNRTTLAELESIAYSEFGNEPIDPESASEERGANVGEGEKLGRLREMPANVGEHRNRVYLVSRVVARAYARAERQVRRNVISGFQARVGDLHESVFGFRTVGAACSRFQQTYSVTRFDASPTAFFAFVERLRRSPKTKSMRISLSFFSCDFHL